jgi:hypothetical protein
MGEGSNKMLDSADTNPTPQKLGKGEVAPHTHCVAQTIPRFKNTPLPLVFSIPQRYKTQSCKHPPVQNKSSHPKKFLQKFKSSVTFAPTPN